MSEWHDDTTFTLVGGQGAERAREGKRNMVSCISSRVWRCFTIELNYISVESDSGLTRHLPESTKILSRVIWMLM